MNFFRIFGVYMRERKIFEIFDRMTRTDAIIKTLPQHPIKNFKDLSKMHIDSKNSEKIHGYLW